MRPEAPAVIVFDLGGVLVDFAGIEALAGLMPDRPSPDVARERWVNCAAVSAFESGAQPDPLEFARRAVTQLELPLAATDFLERFESWVQGPLEGARDLLEALQPLRGQGLTVASLSNTSPLHSAHMAQWLDADDLFDAWCMSYRLGHAKPSAGAFAAVQRIVAPDMAAAEFWFCDDSSTNVEAARSVGWLADQVHGPEQARAALERRGVLAQ